MMSCKYYTTAICSFSGAEDRISLLSPQFVCTRAFLVLAGVVYVVGLSMCDHVVVMHMQDAHEHVDTRVLQASHGLSMIQKCEWARKLCFP